MIKKIKEELRYYDKEEWVLAFCVGVGILVVALICFATFSGGARFADCEKTEAFCTVTDKSSHLQVAGKVYLHKYYLHVTIDDDETKEVHRVHVPSSVYNDVEIGDCMKCIIYYDEDGIFDIQLWEPGLAEENKYD